MDSELSKLRRFALTIGLILLLYALAGIQLSNPPTVHPLGISLAITRPWIFDWVLIVASIYGSFRYWYHGFVLQFSPLNLRKRLRHGIALPDLHQLDSETFRQIQKLIDRYLPGIESGRYTVAGGTHGSPGIYVKLDWALVSFRTKVYAILDSVDYTAPLWLNGVALVCLFATWILR